MGRREIDDFRSGLVKLWLTQLSTIGIILVGVGIIVQVFAV
jgi:hypothetical protein